MMADTAEVKSETIQATTIYYNFLEKINNICDIF